MILHCVVLLVYIALKLGIIILMCIVPSILLRAVLQLCLQSGLHAAKNYQAAIENLKNYAFYYYNICKTTILKIGSFQ